MAKQPTESIGWGWVISCTGVGIFLIAGAFVTQTVWKWNGATTAALIDVGTALFLAAVIFFLERRFTRQLSEVSTAIADLQRATQQRIAEEIRRENGVIDKLKEDKSFSSITSAMLLVNQLRAIPGGSVVVQAAEKPDALRLLFSCIEYVDTHRPVLEIKPLLGTPVPRPGVKSEYQITWQATEDAASAFARFIRVLKDSGQAAVAGRLDLNRAIDELWRTLTEAARLKREGKLKGRLRELVDSDWAVTDVGIESLSHDFMLPGNQVPAGYGLPGTKERLANWKPERPTWVTDEQWERLIQRAKEIFPKVAFTRLSPLNENRKVWTPWVDPAL